MKSATRNFVCPQTGEPCGRRDCKVGYCAEPKVDRRAEAKQMQRQIKREIERKESKRLTEFILDAFKKGLDEQGIVDLLKSRRKR